MAESSEELSPSERTKRYRFLAAEAYARAESTTDPISSARYLSIANSWHGLALEIERPLELTSSDNSSPSQIEPIDSGVAG
jgi:hypothetical protein